jgi:hypothetical protein
MTANAPRPGLWRARAVLIATLAAVALLGSGCGDDQNPAQDGGQQTADGGADSGPGSFFPIAEAEDPCAVAGYTFDGASDCSVVRCPELTCACHSSTPAAPGQAPQPASEITLSACVPAVGCLSLADCTRVCNPKLERTRQACEARIAWAGAQSCSGDDDCTAGTCRQERVGSICIDTIGCADDGHCGEGSACLFDPDLLDPETAGQTSLGTCADGAAGSRCYADRDCAFGRCAGERCTAGLDGDSCIANANCASGFCRIADPMQPSGSCVNGRQGSACVDEGDCEAELHCTGNVCFSDAVGQSCASADHCASGLCVAGRCRDGEPGSTCQIDADCRAGACIGNSCASGTLLSPCYESNDCKAGLSCVRQVCSDGSEYLPCTIDADCAVLACVHGVCSAGGDGSECEADDDCTSQRCANPAGADPGACTSGAPGSTCNSGDNCMSGSCGFDKTCD